MSRPRYLYIGGPLDGQRIVRASEDKVVWVPMLPDTKGLYWAVEIKTPTRLRYHAYKRWRVTDTLKVYVSEDLDQAGLLTALVDGYRKAPDDSKR